MSFTWQNGREITTFAKTGTTASYQYNENGIRTSKTVNGVTTNYELDGSKVIYQTTGSSVVCYIYDETGSPIGMKYNGSYYYFIKNLQCDVIQIKNLSGTAVVYYEYDVWGNPYGVYGSLASTVGAANIFRYRSFIMNVMIIFAGK